METGTKRSTAQLFKDKGNEAFKKANFQAAVEHYTSAIKADPSDHVLPCNRAFARLKLQQWKLAEADCTKSLDLLPEPNCKALFRRGTARRQLNKWNDALQDLKAALTLEPNNTSICAELEAVQSHLQENAKSLETPLPSKAPSSTSSTTSDSEASSTIDPTAGPSSSAALTESRSTDSSNHLMKEVSTTRFTSSGSKSSPTAASGTSSFGALKQLRQKKEEKSSGLLNARSHNNTSISSPTDASKFDTVITTKSAEPNPHSASTIPPIKSFSDFEMRWGMSSEPQRRCSVLETLDPRSVVQLFGEHLEPETLEQIIDALRVSLQSNEKSKISKAVELLQGMDNVSRMKTLTMFLEPDHQKVVRDLLVKFHGFEPDRSVELLNWGI
ncbi:hypothetical protein MJO28_009280 [Puccinia striiformis f. sp. tritici]|uniref:Uncharacterized protein n=1 Tax=Puccinia striiformis f. sp. tritici TaxID=168172 RepID=A0ACC0E7Z9_9BASI|nr:hypothetical protein Pst134EB_018678 [Puccinia striiformis f. sp. tritici]KAI7947372.1 hypothetical protein MJO28_009280 [Puccinia striiformis f. sp. tritici]